MLGRQFAGGLACLLALVACAPAQGGADTADRTVVVSTAAGDRTAHVHHPQGAPAGAPLVVVLHGAGGSGAQVEADLGWDGLADREGFVVAYPDGLDGTWNGGGCCGRARTRGVDDVGYLAALSGRIAEEDGTDPRRVYAVGFSNGAILAYAWACSRPGDLAGIGPVAGAVLVPCAAPGPVAVVAVHGTEDDRVPFGGGAGAGGAQYPTVAGSLAPFLAGDGCSPAPALADDPPAAVGTWTCSSGRPVVRDVIDGGGHAWPGAGPDAGTTDTPLDATGFLWSRLAGP
ncbi:CE1 family esterase [Pseudonocardia adelaidensis]|uniref:PHB depolymerase family esterase n=1 Tax=Pseudonocardia adelaidensis TaxID=648754 RepID=A0ABP9NBX7_9PSEU